MPDNLNHIPLLRLTIPFLCGILTDIYLQPGISYLLLSFGIFCLIYIVLLLFKKLNANYSWRWIFGVFLYLNLALAGATLTGLKYQNSKGYTNLMSENNNQLLIGEISKPVQIKEKTVKAILNIKGVKSNNNWMDGDGKAILYLSKDSLSQLLSIGDIISFEPKLRDVPPPKNPNEFDYRKYLSYHLIYQQAFLRSNNWKLVKQADHSGIFGLASKLRNHLIYTLEAKGIKDDELAVASALILGYKDNIDAQLKSAYSSAGAMHVLAVSGLHVGVIFLIFSRIFSFFEKIKYGKIIKGIILIIILWMYALLTGLSPSVMRAATMFSFVVVSKMSDRKSSFFNTLAASALALLIYNPLYLMEVGFQLSYLAVIGIVIIQPWINNLIYFRKWLPRKLWELTAVSIAAQIATFPLGLLYFHQFPNYFMLSNLIVIPLAIFILYLGLTTLCFSFVPFIGDYLAIGLKYLIKSLNYSVNFIDDLPYSLSENIRFNTPDAWLIYLLIASLVLLIAYRKFRYLIMSFSLLIVFLLSTAWIKYNTLKQRKLVIYNIPQHSAINFIDGTDNILLSDIKLVQNRSKLLFHVQNNWIDKGVEKEKVVRLDHLIKKHQLSNIFRIDNQNLFTKRNFFDFYNYRIAVIDKNFEPENMDKKLKVDLLILTGNTNKTIADLLSVFSVKEIVIDGSNSSFTTERLIQEAEKLNINCWSVLKDGAFFRNI